MRHHWGLGFRQSGFHRVTRVSRVPAIRIFWPRSLSHHAAVPLGLHLKVGWVTQQPQSSTLLPAARGIDDRVKRRTRPAQPRTASAARPGSAAPLGGRGRPQLVQPLPPPAHPLGEARRALPGLRPTRRHPDHLPQAAPRTYTSRIGCKAKAEGDKSMVGKRERPEGVYGRDSRGPRAMVKGRLLEPQPPVRQAHIPRSAPEAESPG